MGRSGLRCSRVGLGTRTWGSDTDITAAQNILKQFVSEGGSLIDVSPHLRNHHSALSMLGEIIRTAIPRDELVISSAAGLRPDMPVGRRIDCSRRTLLAQLDEQLHTLGTDYLDMFSIEFWDETTPVAEVADTLDYAVRSGRVRYVGARGLSGWQLAVLHMAAPSAARALVCAHAEYNLLVRDSERELLPAANHCGIGFVAGAPLARGILAGAYTPETLRERSIRLEEGTAELYNYVDDRTATIVEALTTASEGLGISPTTAALAWTLSRPGVDATVVGISSPNQCADVFAADQARVPKAIAAALSDISASRAAS